MDLSPRAAILSDFSSLLSMYCHRFTSPPRELWTESVYYCKTLNKFLKFAWPYFCDKTTCSIHDGFIFGICHPVLYNPYMASLGRGLYFSRLRDLSNFAKNKVLANKRSFTLVVKLLVWNKTMLIVCQIYGSPTGDASVLQALQRCNHV